MQVRLSRPVIAALRGWCCAVLAFGLCLAGLSAGAQEEERPGDETSISPLERGRQLYFEGDYAGARAAWAPLAEAGNPRALYNMATLYRRGLGVSRDDARARVLLTQSAESGFPEAQYLLADLIMRDDAADEAERQQAVRWWLAAARQAHGLSQYRLGLLYWNGEAVARDLVRGHAWMRLADEHGLEDAAEARGTMEQYLSEAQRDRSAELAESLRAVDAEQAEAAAPPLPDESDPQPVGATASETADGEVTRAPDEDEEPAAAASAASSASTQPAAPERMEEGWQLQLAALKERETAEGLWRRLSDEAPDLVDGLRHRIAVADLGERGTFYRLRIGPFASRAAAQRRCTALEAAGFGCFAVAPGS